MVVVIKFFFFFSMIVGILVKVIKIFDFDNKKWISI